MELEIIIGKYVVGRKKCSRNGEARRVFLRTPHKKTFSIFEENVVLRTLDARRGYTFCPAVSCSQRLFGTKRSLAMRKKFNTFCEANRQKWAFSEPA
jgi:hypothetical protein